MSSDAGLFLGVAFGVTVWLVLSACWLWMCRGVAGEGLRRLFGALAIQISAVVFVFGLITGQGVSAVLFALAPPFALVLFQTFQWFHLLVEQIALPAGVAGLLVLVAFLAVPRLRVWSVAPSFLAMLATAIVVGEGVSQRAMCAKAEALGITEFKRNSLLWSLFNAPREFQFEVHAKAEMAGRRLAWSYREMDWYDVPANALADVFAPAFDCPGKGQPLPVG